MFRITCLNKISQFGLAKLTNQYEQVEGVNEVDAILVRSAAMHDMEFPDTLKAIARAGAGVNNIPLDRCAENGIVVFNTPGANANGVKELVLAGLLLASRDIIGGVDWVKANKDVPDLGKVVEKNKSKFAGNEIKAKRLGVVGLGAIGVLVANAASNLEMEVIGYDPYISVHSAWSLSRNVRPAKSLDDIFAECDFITVHVPLSNDTKGMFNKEAFAKMKDGVTLLNFSRDSLVNDADLLEAIASGKVKHYVTDFPNGTVAGQDGVIAIPHLGASTDESEDNCAIMAVNQITDYLENGNIINSVNYPTCDMGVCTKAGRVTIHHKNIPNMLSQFTSFFASENINISDMINKSRGQWAYSVLDVEAPVSPAIAQKIAEIDGVIKVRVIK